MSVPCISLTYCCLLYKYLSSCHSHMGNGNCTIWGVINQFYLISFCCFSKFLLIQWKTILLCAVIQFAAEFPGARMNRQLLIPVLFLNSQGYTQRIKFIFQIILRISFPTSLTVHCFTSSQCLCQKLLKAF